MQRVPPGSLSETVWVLSLIHIFKNDGAVKLNAYFNNFQTLEENNYDYCGTMDEAGHTGHCAALGDGYEQNEDGTTPLTFDDPTGLKKDDYVLFTYSFRTLDDDGDETVSYTHLAPYEHPREVSEIP